MLSRRRFLTGSAVLAVSPLLSLGAEKKHRLENFGFISGVLRNEIKGDWQGALKKAVGYGFTEYEGGAIGGSPSEFLAYCKSIGLKPVAGGVGMLRDKAKLQAGFDKLNAMEMKYAVCYWPWLVGAPFKLDDCKRSAELLNQMGALAKQNGLVFCWHNHDKEFWEMEKGQPFHYLMEHTDKELVQCEMDIYWVAKGDADPLSVLKQYAGRIPILHVKDMAPGPKKDFACPGSGIIDFGLIFVEAQRQGIKHYFVERDKIVDGLACLESSGDYLRNLRF